MAMTMNQEFTKKVMEYLNYGWEFCTQAHIGNVGEHAAVLLENEGKYVVVFYRARTQLNAQGTEYIISVPEARLIFAIVVCLIGIVHCALASRSVPFGGEILLLLAVILLFPLGIFVYNLYLLYTTGGFCLIC